MQTALSREVGTRLEGELTNAWAQNKRDSVTLQTQAEGDQVCSMLLSGIVLVCSSDWTQNIKSAKTSSVL